MLITEDEQLPLCRTPFSTLLCMRRAASDDDEKLRTFPSVVTIINIQKTNPHSRSLGNIIIRKSE